MPLGGVIFLLLREVEIYTTAASGAERSVHTIWLNARVQGSAPRDRHRASWAVRRIRPASDSVTRTLLS